VRPCIAQVPQEELEHVASRLADLDRDAALTPVRFVKTKGSHPNTTQGDDGRVRPTLGRHQTGVARRLGAPVGRHHVGRW
jgi:hypothetical protein